LSGEFCFFSIKAGGYLRVVTRLAETCGALAVCLALAAPAAAQSARLPAPPLSFELDLAFVSLQDADPTVVLAIRSYSWSERRTQIR
jgi:hypothetical protein